MKSNLSLKSISPSNIDEEDFSAILTFVLSLPFIEKREYDVSVESVANNVAAWLFETESNSIAYSEDGKVVGVCLNTVQSQWWTDSVSLVNTVAYVLPEYRSKALFQQMLQKAEEYAKMKGMKFYFSPVACNKLDVKIRLLKGLGYTEVGAIMEAP